MIKVTLWLCHIILLFYSFNVHANHALSLFKDIKYSKDFKHFDYVNPNAPKNGTIRLSHIGGFDTLNGLNGKGNSAPALELLYDRLMKPSLDEPASEYGLLAKSVRYADDYSWVEYDLRETARWSDNRPITPQDVIFTFDLLREKGNPIYRYYYANIKKVEAISKYTVRFTFDSANNRELPLITGQLTILPKHYWENRDFTKSLTEIPVTSGPYKIDNFILNRSISYRRNKDYWAKDLPVNVGYYNFDTIHYEIYRDIAVEFEAFKSGAYDVRHEYSAKNWERGYNFPAIHSGKIIRDTYKTLHPKPMQGLLFNLRKPIFQDPVLRTALQKTFDFTWLNQHLFYGSYKKTQSFFEDSELKITWPLPHPVKNILEKWGADTNYHPDCLDTVPDIPADTYIKTCPPPTPIDRDQIKNIVLSLKKAGYIYHKGKLFTPNNQPIQFEVLNSDASFERVLLPIVDNMKKIGIQTHLRTIDLAHYTRRVQKFDFDMIMSFYGQSSSPGNEQREYWGASAATRNGSRNYSGIKDPIIDKAINALIFSKDRQSLIHHTQALDYLLQQKKFLIPLWYGSVNRIAYDVKFGVPKQKRGYGIGGNIHLWWDLNN